MDTTELTARFTAMAEAAACTVKNVDSMQEALQYAVDLCASKAPCELLCDEDCPKGPDGPDRVPTRVQRVVAAPELSDEDFAILQSLCAEKGFLCVRNGLRRYAAGIDVGLNTALAGVAASGTCLCPATNEDVRLAGMICEDSILMLKRSAIYPDLPSIAGLMREMMGDGNPTFTSLITGPSRTADIECVSAIGVHGPLEMHILLMGD